MKIKSIKSKICFVCFIAVASVGVAFGVNKVVEITSATSAGTIGWISDDTRAFSWSVGSLSYNTFTYKVIADGTSTSLSERAMCIEPDKTDSIGSGGAITQLNNKELIQIMLATDAGYGSTAYSGLNSSILSAASNSGLSVPSNNGSDVAFVIGHILAGNRYHKIVAPTDSNNVYFSLGNDVYYMNNLLEEIDNWFAANAPNEWENWNLMILDPTTLLPGYGGSADGYQTVGWLERKPAPAPATFTLHIKKYDENNHPLSGATFYVYPSDPGLGDPETVTLTGTNEKTLTRNVGEWCVVETEAPSGYDIGNNSVQCLTGTAGSTVEYVFVNRVKKGSVKIKKVDADSQTTIPSDGASLAGAVFQVQNCADVSYTNCTDYRAMTINATGTATMTELPNGYYKVFELSAGAGYVTNSNDYRNFSISANNLDVDLSSIPFENTVIKGGLTLIKKRQLREEVDNEVRDKSEPETFAGVSFEIYRGDDLITTITTNGSGEASTANNALPYGTYTIKEVSNAANKAFDIIENQTVTISENGVMVDVGTFTDLLDDPVLATYAREGSSSADNPVRELAISREETIIDRIVYDGTLTTGRDYKVCGEVWTVTEPISNAVKLGDSCTEWTQQNNQNEVEVTFTGIDTTGVIGGKVSIIQRLYAMNGDESLASGREWLLLELHNGDLSNPYETLTVVSPRIVGTVAVDASDGDKIIEPENGRVIRDTVSYENLEPGREYYLCAILMDKNTGDVLKINGLKVNETCVSMGNRTSDTGSFGMSLGVNADTLPGATIVVFETLYADSSKSEVVAEHKDLNDAAQTVYVRPRIGTKATDKYDGDQEIGVGNASVIDTVTYEGLSAGAYVVRGELMELGEGDTVEETGIKAEKTFVIVEDDLTNGLTSGEIEVSFEFDSREYVGKKLVVFEELYEIAESNLWITEHKDEKDEGQTVMVTEAKIGTTATDALKEGKVLAPNEKVTIVDEVKYEGLIPGTTYTLKGILMDKETGKVLVLGDGKEVSEVVLVFEAEEESGTLEMEFEISTAGLEEKEIVVFETLYMGKEVEAEIDKETGEVITDGIELTDEDIIAVHNKIDDDGQTVGVDKLPEVEVPDTGSIRNSDGGIAMGGDNKAVLIGVLCGVVMTGVVIWIRVGHKSKVDFK